MVGMAAMPVILLMGLADNHRKALGYFFIGKAIGSNPLKTLLPPEQGKVCRLLLTSSTGKTGVP